MDILQRSEDQFCKIVWWWVRQFTSSRDIWYRVNGFISDGFVNNWLSGSFSLFSLHKFVKYSYIRKMINRNWNGYYKQNIVVCVWLEQIQITLTINQVCYPVLRQWECLLTIPEGREGWGGQYLLSWYWWKERMKWQRKG